MAVFDSKHRIKSGTALCLQACLSLITGGTPELWRENGLLGSMELQDMCRVINSLAPAWHAVGFASEDPASWKINHFPRISIVRVYEIREGFYSAHAVVPFSDGPEVWCPKDGIIKINPEWTPLETILLLRNSD